MQCYRLFLFFNITSMHIKALWSKKKPKNLSPLSCHRHQFVCFYFLYTMLPSSSQGVSVEFLCRPTSAGFDLDVCSARHDRQALHPLSDPLCCLWLTAGFCHCDGALCPTERGRGWFKVCFVYLDMQTVCVFCREYTCSVTVLYYCNLLADKTTWTCKLFFKHAVKIFSIVNMMKDWSVLFLGPGRFQMPAQKLPRPNQWWCNRNLP